MLSPVAVINTFRINKYHVSILYILKNIHIFLLPYTNLYLYPSIGVAFFYIFCLFFVNPFYINAVYTVTQIRERKKMGLDEKNNLVFFGAGITNQQMDVEFKRLYDSLLAYKHNIFHLVDTICNDCDAGERLAMNIAERDCALLQRLVAKEVDLRRMSRKAGKESILEELRKDETPELTLQSILQTRADSLKESVKSD